MAKRLGKRERAAKKAIIQGNLKDRPVAASRVIRTHSGSLVVVSGLSQVSTHRDSLSAGTHTVGFRAPQRRVSVEQPRTHYVRHSNKLSQAELDAIARYRSK